MNGADSGGATHITEREVFSVCVCVDDVWRGDATALNVNKERVLASGWPRAMAILFRANHQVLAYLERNGSLTASPRGIIELTQYINSWLPPSFQVPGETSVEMMEIISDPLSSSSQQHLSKDPQKVFLNWLFLFSGAVSHVAEMLDYDPYTVMVKTLEQLSDLPP